ncbi:MAG TPA: cytochrome c oxidase subunit 3 [Pyrinomonadaceae bacterium]|nr:cytochrome c oxidase subunit 3 [Pyrinomonadaceae bacterium]
MATTVTGTKPFPKAGFGGTSGKGSNGNGGPNGNGHRQNFVDRKSAADRYRIGMWVALAAILMMFTALSSAYIVRAASSDDWQPLHMPRVLWLSTALIVISSFVLEYARRLLKAGRANAHQQFLSVTVALGFGFLVSQLFAWRQLAKQGIYIATNPHSSFFYLLTATHGLHLMGGLAGLLFLTSRSRLKRKSEDDVIKGQAQTDAVTLYWHFMDVLWLYLFFLLFVWR